MRYNLSLDESESIGEIFNSNGWPVLLKIVDILVKDRQERVIQFNLADGDRQLALEKARAEGAQSLYVNVLNLKESFYKKGNKR